MSYFNKVNNEKQHWFGIVDTHKGLRLSSSSWVKIKPEINTFLINNLKTRFINNNADDYIEDSCYCVP